MAAQKFKYLILGGGMVAGYAAKQFVEEGLKPGELAIVSSDTALPYERPPLSKGVLVGRDADDSVLISPESFYREHGIEVRLKTVIERVDFARRMLRTRGGDEFGYEKLLIATGARPRLLTIPGATMDGVHYLRSLDDSRGIRAGAEAGRRALVIGGGFIGMEAASALAQRRLAVTLLIAEERIWARLFTAEISDFFRRYYEARGVKFLFKVDLVSFWGDTRVRSLTLGSGDLLPADLAVAGIGVLPVTDIFQGTGLELRDGVLVNEYLETNVPNVYAAGDVARYHDVLFGGDRRVEHWDNAVKQGQHVARVMMGIREAFDNVPYFFSDVFDLSWEFWGDTTGADRILTRGDFDSRSVSVWWLKQGRLAAAFVMNRPDEERETAPELIRSRRAVSF